MDKEEDLDLLDLEEGSDVDSLPEAVPFSAPHPKRPLLLMFLGLGIIVVAVFIIIATISDDSQKPNVSKTLDMPQAGMIDHQPPVEHLNVPPKPVDIAPKTVVLPEPVEKPVARPVGKPIEVPVEQPKPSDYVLPEPDGVPVRVVEDRNSTATFNPEKPVKAKPVKSEPKKKAAPAPVKKAVATTGQYYAQLGSYATRDSAIRGKQDLIKKHPSLFDGKQVEILPAEVNGKTMHRLRVFFRTIGDAKGFCSNAKSDGLKDCYEGKK